MLKQPFNLVNKILNPHILKAFFFQSKPIQQTQGKYTFSNEKSLPTRKGFFGRF
jgi:hypothetical protein